MKNSSKNKRDEEREDHLKTKAELKQAKEDIAKLQGKYSVNAVLCA